MRAGFNAGTDIFHPNICVFLFVVLPLFLNTERMQRFELINNNFSLFYLLDSLILMAPCHPQQPPKFKPEKGAEG